MKIKLFWSKKDKDWRFSYPDTDGKYLMGVFFDLIKTKGHRMDWQKDLDQMIREHDYDPTTLQITCKKLPTP